MRRLRSKKNPRSNFGQALRWARSLRGVAQEQFDQVSSRTYISNLERGLKNPTLGKIDTLADVLQMHPLALVALGYVERLDAKEVEALLLEISDELARMIGDVSP